MAIPKIDLFLHPHKEQRLLFSELSVKIAALDAGNEEELSAVTREVKELLAMLHDHASNEDTFVLPLLKDFTGNLEEEHIEIDRLMLGVSDCLKHLCDVKTEDSVMLFYQAFHRLLGHYLLHLDKEETQIMPFVWQHIDPTAIVGIIVAFKTYKQPEEAANMLPDMLKAMTKEEQDLMLVSISKHAPRAAYEASKRFIERL